MAALVAVAASMAAAMAVELESMVAAVAVECMLTGRGCCSLESFD